MANSQSTILGEWIDSSLHETAGPVPRLLFLGDVVMPGYFTLVADQQNELNIANCH